MPFLRSVQFLSKSLSGSRFYQKSTVFYKIVQFNLSDIGEGIREVTVKDWFVKVGDQVSQFDDICMVESDKASVSITSRFDGTVKKLYYDVGDVALVGKPLVDIDLDELSEQEKADVVQKTPLENEKSTPIETLILEDKSKEKSTLKPLQNKIDGPILTVPSVRRIAKENNIDLSTVKATGKGGRVLKEDILRHLGNPVVATSRKSSSEQSPSVSDRTIPIQGVKKAMVKTMTKSNSIPTFGYCDEINMTSLIELRNEIKPYAEKKGVNLSFMPFFIKALSKALEDYPELNASVDENCDNITLKSRHNIGVAMDTSSGLIVPNIKNVNSLSILEIGKYLNKLLEDGRNLKLGPADMSGGTITISNIGVVGGTYLRPLILPPEVCILALGKTKLTPIFTDDGEIEKAHILTASWAADHRVIDGATLAKCSNAWKTYIEKPSILLIDL